MQIKEQKTISYNMETPISLSDYDRSLIMELTESNNRLARVLEERQARKDDTILYTCSQAAAYLGRDASTISRMIRDGRLHKVYEGGLSGIRKSELDKYKRD